MKKKRILQTAAMAGLLAWTSSSQAQLPVTDGLFLWLDATDPNTLFQDSGMTTLAGPGDNVALWFDKSGNDYHAFQDDDLLQPTVEANAINGNNSVRLDGLDGDGMYIDDSAYLGRPYTAFIVNQYWGPTTGRTLQSQDINWLHGLWAGNHGHFADGWVGNSPAEIGVPYVTDAVDDFDSSSVMTNGLDITASTAPIGEPGRLGIASVGVYPGEVSDADISEIIIYDRILDEGELTATREFLYGKYSVDVIEPPARDQAFAGQLGVFTGGDPGEGLDFDGDFRYAINVGGPGGYVVGDAEFTDGSEFGIIDDTPEVFITDANEIIDWHLDGEYGDTQNDDELEGVMESIRWNVPPGLDIELDVEAGTQYKLQLLFAESCCNRGFDLFLEDEQMVDNMNVQRIQGGINNGSQGVFYTHTFTAGDGTLNITLGGSDPGAPDNNPILNGLTLEVLAGLLGDFNGNGALDAEDIDLLSAAANGAGGAQFDLTGDGNVDDADRDKWVVEIANTYYGDSDLDGEFSSTDFVRVFTAGEYEDAIDGNSTWSEGDWNGDGDFNSSDFVVAFQGGGFEIGPRTGVAAVPEPSAFGLWGLAACGLMGWLRRRIS